MSVAPAKRHGEVSTVPSLLSLALLHACPTAPTSSSPHPSAQGLWPWPCCLPAHSPSCLRTPDPLLFWPPHPAGGAKSAGGGQLRLLAGSCRGVTVGALSRRSPGRKPGWLWNPT